jgi:hypothetical protein
MRPARSAPAILLTALLLAGCGPIATPGSTADPTGHSAPQGAIPVGAGPQTHYTAQPQPAAGSCHYRYEHREPLPDPNCTPGALNPKVTQATIGRTICRKGGYTSGIRPSTSVTGKEKRLNAKSYSFTGSMGDAEYDHLISLQLGGDPNDARNVWVEPADPGHKRGSGVNNLKDPVETKLHTAVCARKVTLAAAQKAIAADWTTALSRLGLA